VVKDRSAASAAPGVTVSSPPARVHPAAAASTVTDWTSSPVRSRLKADSAWVARAVMVAVARSRSVPGS
jgi:hypothetical protein